MKKIFILTAFILVTGTYSRVSAQSPNVVQPVTSGDKNMNDTNVKTRSMDLERVDRDSKKNNSSKKDAATNTAPTTAEDVLAAKYEQIKVDYEQIQLSQDAVIKTYQGSGKIDYAQIGKSALEINSGATRLKSNLFPAPLPPIEKADAKNKVNNEEKTIEKESQPAKSLRELIIELDNAMGSFATSAMFQNLRVVDPAISAKAKLDLEKIIEMSAALNGEAQKMNK